MTLKKLKFLIIFHGPRALKDNWVISGVGEWKINIHKKKNMPKILILPLTTFGDTGILNFKKKILRTTLMHSALRRRT